MISILVVYPYGSEPDCLEFEVTRVPCVGEYLLNSDKSNTLTVVEVTHALNPDLDNEPVALVRVK